MEIRVAAIVIVLLFILSKAIVKMLKSTHKILCIKYIYVYMIVLTYYTISSFHSYLQLIFFHFFSNIKHKIAALIYQPLLVQHVLQTLWSLLILFPTMSLCLYLFHFWVYYILLVWHILICVLLTKILHILIFWLNQKW